MKKIETIGVGRPDFSSEVPVMSIPLTLETQRWVIYMNDTPIILPGEGLTRLPLEFPEEFEPLAKHGAFYLMSINFYPRLTGSYRVVLKYFDNKEEMDDWLNATDPNEIENYGVIVFNGMTNSYLSQSTVGVPFRYDQYVGLEIHNFSSIDTEFFYWINFIFQVGGVPA